MGDSFQNEIPKGRINLKVEVQTNGSAQSIELPHKSLVMGDFSNGKGTGPVLERKRLQVTKFTRDSVMKDLNPELNLMVDNKLGSKDDVMQVNLSFSALDDFHPESIVEQVPNLNRMLAMRNLLKELRANLIDNHALKKKLGEICSDPQARESLKECLHTLLPQSKSDKE